MKPVFRGLSSKPFRFAPLFDNEANPVHTQFRKLDVSGSMHVVKGPDGLEFLKIDPQVLTELTTQAVTDINYFFRTAHLSSLRRIFDDPDSSANDKFVAYELLRNATISSARILPSCQDTGTGLALCHRGERILTGGGDEEAIARGVYESFKRNNFRYSQVAPLTMFKEQNTGTNLPCQVDIHLGHDPLKYEFLFIAKGGGSANKTQLIQKTKAVLRDEELEAFITERLSALGTAACPPYHLALVIGGLSAEQCLKAVKLLSCKALDGLPNHGSELGQAFRDLEWEKRVLEIGTRLGIGAQFGGKYFLHDARVLRLPRHGASLPIGIGVSCSADRQAQAYISPEGVYLEQLEQDPGRFLPSGIPTEGEALKFDIDRLGMKGILSCLSKLPVSTRISLTGTMVVARDIAHAKIAERVRSGGEIPAYLRDYPVYYAGPAKKPDGKASGSFGPTTAGRMDPYLSELQSRGGSLITIGKGNRSDQAVVACKDHGGFYLGSIGGVAAALAESFIKSVEVLDFEELGMEAVWKIKVTDFPAFVVIDDKGNDFYKGLAEDIRLGRKKIPSEPVTCAH
jgi:fumarate hydratase, class I